MTGKLKDQLDALATELGTPQQVTDLITRELAAETMASAPGLRVGDEAPDFELPDPTGRRVRLSTVLRQKPVALSFYRGEWCPYCNLELRAWQHRFDDVAAAGGQFLAITPQRPSNALSLTERHALKYPVLSDLDQEAIRAYRVRYDLPPTLKDLYANTFAVDLTTQNADGCWSLTVPATFVISEQHRVRFAYAHLDWRVRAEPADVLAVLREEASLDKRR